jgi:hypothetical protein
MMAHVGGRMSTFQNVCGANYGPSGHRREQARTRTHRIQNGFAQYHERNIHAVYL